MVTRERSLENHPKTGDRCLNLFAVQNEYMELDAIFLMINDYSTIILDKNEQVDLLRMTYDFECLVYRSEVRS